MSTEQMNDKTFNWNYFLASEPENYRPLPDVRVTNDEQEQTK